MAKESAALGRVSRRVLSAPVFAFLILIAALFVRSLDPMPVEQLRLSTFDMYNRIDPREIKEESPVAIVDLDERSLAAVGQWPWSRDVVGQLLLALRQQGAIVVGFDMVFAEPDRTSPSLMAERVPESETVVRDLLRKMPTNDEVMANAMRYVPVVLGQASSNSSELTDPHPTARFTSVGAALAVDGAESGNPRPYITSKPGMVTNLEVLAGSASGLGVFSVDKEIDGLVRRVPMVMEVSDIIKPTLSLEMLRVGFQANSIVTVVNPAGLAEIRLQSPAGNYPIPTDNKGRIWVNFAEPATFNVANGASRLYVSASDVLDGSLPQGRLMNKLVLIGTSATGLLDIRATPISPTLPGVEVHANVIENILWQDFTEYPTEMILWEMIATFSAGLILILLVPRLGPGMTLLGLLGALAALVGTSWYLYESESTLLDVTFPAGVTIFIYAMMAYSNYLRESREKQQVRGAFGQYLSPALVEQLADNPEQLRLGGETRRMTMLFCDVRGFTTISESYREDPQGLTLLINRLLTPLTNEILIRNGTIDKYMGDCIMAFWNAPLEDTEQELHAVQSSEAMFKSLETLNAERKQEAVEAGVPFLPLNIGIGVNTGDVVVGNMGSDQRFDYSVLGDAVNLAARLEGQSKSYGVGIVIGPDTAEEIKDQAPVLELDSIKVKGKKEAVTIYTVAGDLGTQTREEFKTLAAEHAKMLEAYRAQEWDRVVEMLGALKGQLSGVMDGYYDIWKERVADLRTQGLPEDWDGVFVATTK